MSSDVVCTLTAPRDAQALRAGLGGMPPHTWEPLDAAQVRAARQALTAGGFDFSVRETRFCDPPIPGQAFALFSFTPARGATPDPEGIYGFGKVRGTFATEDECRAREELLVREVDSYHTILAMRTGQPFPLAVDAAPFAAESRRVDLRERMTRAEEDARRAKDAAERCEVENIHRREEAIQERNRRVEAGGGEDPLDPEEAYVTLRVKRAQLAHAFAETRKRLQEIREAARTAHGEVAASDAENPELRAAFLSRVRGARGEAGMAGDFSSQTFFPYLTDDVDVPSMLVDP